MTNPSGSLFKKPCTFIKTVVRMADMPERTLPEVAFVGRSNVGKSSLINALVNQKNLARASHTPGRTQALNYFDLAGQLYLVDLPGYGYAKAPVATINAWTHLIEDYLSQRPSLKRVFVLVDSRHGLKDSDRQMLEYLNHFVVSHQIILTKVDKISKTAVSTLIDSLQSLFQEFPALYPEIIATSSDKKQGIDELRKTIDDIPRAV